MNDDNVIISSRGLRFSVLCTFWFVSVFDSFVLMMYFVPKAVHGESQGISELLLTRRNIKKKRLKIHVQSDVKVRSLYKNIFYHRHTVKGFKRVMCMETSEHAPSLGMIV